MEIKSLKLWNFVFYYALSLLLFFQCVCGERKLKSKEHQLKGFILNTERRVEIEPCCWETNPLFFHFEALAFFTTDEL